MYEGEIIESEVASSQPMQIDMCKKNHDYIIEHWRDGNRSAISYMIIEKMMQ